jgi:hypothetical protein
VLDALASWRETSTMSSIIAASGAYRTLQLVVRHTDSEREFAYDKDPLLGSGTDQVLATASADGWTVIDMAADWSAIYPP